MSSRILIDIDETVRREILKALWLSMLCQISWAGDKDFPDLADFLHFQGTILRWGNPDGEIDPFLHKMNNTVCQEEPYGQLWPGFQKVRDNGKNM